VWWASPQVAAAIAIPPAVLAVFLVVHELTLHLALDGVTFRQAGTNLASSIALSRGQLPYHDFVLTQPPGMSVLLLPFAWVTHGGSAATAMSAARVVTGLVSVADVFLVGLTARHHGIASTFIAGVLFATFPFAYLSTGSYMLEPYLVFFCLLAYAAAFQQGELVRGGRLVLAGAFIGYAIAIKPWAVVPAIVLIICAAIQWRQALVRVLGGLAIGIGVPCILFFLAAPGAFWTDVVVSELGGGGHSTGSLSTRISELLGLGAPIGITHPGSLALGVAVVIAILVVVAAVSRASTSTTQDWAILGATIGLVAIGLLASQIPVAYTYLVAAFGAILLGNTIGTILSIVSSLSISTSDMSSTVAGGFTILAVALMIGVVSVTVPKEAHFEEAYFIKHGTNPAAAIDSLVPNGACVVSNNPEALILANRFAQLPSGCTMLADPSGIEKAAGNPTLGVNNPTVVSQWDQVLRLARFVVIAPGNPPIPWSPLLRAFFAQNFQLVHNAPYRIFVSKTPTLPGS
jgi:alpha-1,2-mannosyltransferase